MSVVDNQQTGKTAKVIGIGNVIMYPDNCIVVPKKDVIELLKRLEVVKKNLQALLA